MKTISLTSDVRVSELLEQAAKENLVIRTPEGRQFVIAEIDDFDREVELTGKNAELMELLAERSKEEGVYSAQELRRELGL